MSIFKINLKTRNGNSLKQKQTITVYYEIKHLKGDLKSKLTFKVIYGKGKIYDTKKIYNLKNPESIKSFEDATLKVFINLFHIIDKIVKDNNLNPDFILFISTSSKDTPIRSISNMFLYDLFKETLDRGVDDIRFLNRWNDSNCNLIRIKREELLILRDFKNLYKNSKIMIINPKWDTFKYAKSIKICNDLKDRINGLIPLFRQ